MEANVLLPESLVALMQCGSTEKNKKLSYRGQTARRFSANAMTWLTALKHAHPHMCYHAKFSVLNQQA